MARRSRHLLVWLHVVTSVGWGSQAAALFALVQFGFRIGDTAAFALAELVDVQVLQFCATTSAFSGIALSALTPWGFFRHWWVLAKFAITTSQLYAGIFLLSPRLGDAAEGGPPSPALRVGSLLMASAIAFQAWLSTAKPGRRTPWARHDRQPVASTRAFAFCTAVPAADLLLGEFVLGRSIPVLSLLVAVGLPVIGAVRSRRSRGSGRPAHPTGSASFRSSTRTGRRRSNATPRP
ncbi:hypothetical protein [Umezawaea beigongshangensis]|uniref:hypothetical protein n=1 Tax=Umezawaea beigongshangensis TaxID=2780383 RepID=UPI0018F23673|nr:hypothetical protein [Umezawaea beigongshangensis]